MRRYSDTVTSPVDTVLPSTVVLVGTIVIFIANLFGLWWITMLLGALIGLLPWPGKRTVAVAAGAAILGWGLGLLWLAIREPVGDAASVVAGVLGLPSIGAITIVLTLILAAILAMAGAWLGTAIRGLVDARFRDPYGQL